MSRLLVTLLMSVAAISVSGMAIAADNGDRDAIQIAQAAGGGNGGAAAGGPGAGTGGNSGATGNGSATGAGTGGNSGSTGNGSAASPGNGGATTGNAGTSPGNSGGAGSAERQQELSAALKSCQSMTGREKRTCVSNAKKKYGQM